MNPALNLQVLIAENRLIRKAWTGRDATGRETACLLAAMSPAVAGSKNIASCPAEVMPAWLAHLTPWMDDAGSMEAWPGMVRRYADLAGRWHVLTPEAWQRLDYVARRLSVIEARSHVDGSRKWAKPILLAIDGVVALLDRAIAGDIPTKQEWSKAAEAAAEVAAAEAAAAWRAAAAGRAAEAAAEAAAAEAAAAEVAAAAAAEAAAAEAAAAEAAEAAAAAADRITTAILDAIEAEIVATPVAE